MGTTALHALTLRQLRFFSVLVEEGQFGRAARRLSITQPALSNAIKQMERLVGAELLTRSTHQLQLTPLGAEILARTDFVVHTVDSALKDIDNTVQRGRALVRIGVIPSASARVVAAVGEFLQEEDQQQRAGAPAQRSRMDLAWRDAPSTTLLAEVRSGQLDLAIAAITEPPGSLVCTDLFRDPLVLVLRRDHALAQANKPVAWQDIGHERLALFESGSMPALGESARAQFAQHAEPHRVSYAETLYALARGGMALGLMPRLYTAALRDPDLVVLPLVTPHIERRVVLVYQPGPMRSEVVQALRAFLQQRFAAAPAPNKPARRAKRTQ
ncbi:transcriptional regulator [Acidovorax sp. CF316]|uniref:LysR family transcriptional regulator n=1 Tax=Acidovorax sp. CF316 TaxID=1144317 RepID=UPI00026BDE77|nr:LysR family transcriptional regulator [Acidovorax sp. CF316]EJE53159.1 transcriptional regulator [Acidovorax sp. CF316]